MQPEDHLVASSLILSQNHAEKAITFSSAIYIAPAISLSMPDYTSLNPGSSLQISGIRISESYGADLMLHPHDFAIATAQIKQPLSHWLPP
jgi:hypothetical protein